MSQFTEILFSPAEFANLAKIDRTKISELEHQGQLQTIRKKIGNVERKMIPLISVQEYFRSQRAFQIESAQSSGGEAVATATASARNSNDLEFRAERPKTLEESVLAAERALSSQSAAQKILSKPLHKIQMFYNVKGGTGKSTLTAQFAMRSAMYGLKVLALDLDGQGHLTVNLDVLDSHERPSIYDVLINDLPIADAIMNIGPGLDLIPANLGLCNIEIPLNSKTRREYRLRDAIQKIASHYDLIVADTNPAASILNCSMLVAAEQVTVVCATNPLSFHGMSLVMNTIQDMEKEFERNFNITIVPNLYDSREVISQEVLGELKSQFPQNCARSVVNRSADLNEATKRRATVWSVNSKGVGAHDIGNLTEELLFG